MTLDRTWLLATARAERDAMGRTIQYTPPEAWDAESACAGWRTRDIVSHLAAGDASAAAALGGEVPSELEEFLRSRDGAPMNLDEFNDWTVARRADQPVFSMARAWGSAADLFLARSALVGVQEWGSRKVPWVAGEIGVSYLIQSRVMEWYLHGEDILAAGGNPPRLEHPPIFCVNDLAARTIPYALAVAGLSFPGKSIRIELDGVGEGSWHRGLAPRETPPPDKAPDALIEGRGHAFCLVAGRRAPAEPYLAEGVLQTSGDDDLAETVLAHLRAFAA
jgi:uncharacterized protein (TIGR03083 family)